MTKRQWFLVAGTLLLAAACNNPASPFCDYDDEDEGFTCVAETPVTETDPTVSFDDPTWDVKWGQLKPTRRIF